MSDPFYTEYSEPVFLSPSTLMLLFILTSTLIALIMAFLIFMLLLPENKRKNLNGFFKTVADVFNFKGLLVEGIFRFTYIFATFFIFLMGFFMLFLTFNGESLAIPGLITMLVGPIVIRIGFEVMMLLWLLVKNVMQINQKLSRIKVVSEEDISSEDETETDNNDVDEQVETPIVSEVYKPIESLILCPQCGTARQDEQALFCPVCGNKYE